MLIQRIKVSNYKTYLDLDLDLTVDEERPIILIGGSNGGGKTTLFEAISGALYGLKSRKYFDSPANFHDALRHFFEVDFVNHKSNLSSLLTLKFQSFQNAHLLCA